MAANLRIFKEYVRLHLKSAMEYRLNFFTQTTFMILNDATWMIVWYFLFKEIGTLNGYTAIDAMLIFSIGAFCFGIIFTFFGNIGNIWLSVADGGFDYFLNKPVDELFHSAISRMSYSAIGDILFGIIMMLIITKEKILLAIIASLLGSIILLSFQILISSLSFYIDKPKNLTKTLHRLILGFSVWPLDTYPLQARTILYFLLIAFITAFPRRIIINPSLNNWLIMISISILFLLFSIAIFKKGVKRYESGNMMTVRS